MAPAQVTSGRLFSLATTTLSLAGCDAPDFATGSVLQAQRCPPAGCEGPPDPGDPNPKPPKDPPPPQPDPAKWRTAYIPISYVASTMNDVLSNTLAQISQTTGPALAIPSKVCQRTAQSAADEQDCKDACNSDPQLTLAQKAQCRTNCASKTTCTNVCGSYYTTSYLRWGPAAAAASVKNSNSYCDQTTCPSCPTRTQVANLKNIDLSAKIPRLHADIPVTGASIDCSIPTLNSVDAQQALLGVFGGLTEQYVTKVLGQQFDRFGDVEPQYGQLKVGYWIK